MILRRFFGGRWSLPGMAHPSPCRIRAIGVWPPGVAADSAKRSAIRPNAMNVTAAKTRWMSPKACWPADRCLTDGAMQGRASADHWLGGEERHADRAQRADENVAHVGVVVATHRARQRRREQDHVTGDEHDRQQGPDPSHGLPQEHVRDDELVFPWPAGAPVMAWLWSPLMSLARSRRPHSPAAAGTRRCCAGQAGKPAAIPPK